MRPRFCFDICWESYKAARCELERGGIRALDTSAFCGDRLWRPRWRPYLQDFCADFEITGVRALSDPHLASRLILFRLFHVGLAEYAPARRFLGVGEMTWVVWTEQIRELVGSELAEVGLYPVRDYFQEPFSRKRELPPQPTISVFARIPEPRLGGT